MGNIKVDLLEDGRARVDANRLHEAKRFINLGGKLAVAVEQNEIFVKG